MAGSWNCACRAASLAKVLAESRTFDNIIFFPTYLPRGANSADPCAPAGTNRAYAIAVDDGRPEIDRNRDGETTTEDRYAPLATAGIAPEFSLLMTRAQPGQGGQGNGPLGGRALTCLVGVEVVQGGVHERRRAGTHLLAPARGQVTAPCVHDRVLH